MAKGIKEQAIDLITKKIPLSPEVQKMVAKELDKRWTQIAGKVTEKVKGVIDSKNEQKSAPGGNPAKWTDVPDSIFGAGEDYGINAIAYGNKRFVAVADGGKIAYSADGIKWTAVSNSIFGDYSIYGIAYGNNRFVAVGWSDKIAYSVDGIKWTAVNSTFSEGAFAIAYGGDKFVAVGKAGEMAYSPDGASWTTVSDSSVWDFDNGKFTYQAEIKAIAYGGNRFVAVGEQGKIAYSPDGEKWTAVADSKFGTSNNTIEGIAYGIADKIGGRFVAVGAGGKIAYSPDGAKWTAASNNLFDYIYGIAYGSGRWVAVGHCGQMAYSPDGVTWTSAADTSSEKHLHAIAYGIVGNAAGRFAAGGTDGSMWYSD